MKRIIAIALLAMPAFTFAAAAPTDAQKVTFEPAKKGGYTVFIGGTLHANHGKPAVGATFAIGGYSKVDPKAPATVIATQKEPTMRRAMAALLAARQIGQ